MPERMPHTLRADAEDNRERVLDAARELFSERGLDVTMRDIARRAEVGPATLYRRFPTKQDLVRAAFAGEMVACKTIVDDGCADQDPWRGFCSVLLRIGELNARNQGFVDAFLSTFPGAFDLAAHRTGMLRSLADLCRRAQESGTLRADFTMDDFVLALLAGRGATSGPMDVRVRRARRLSALLVDAFRA